MDGYEFLQTSETAEPLHRPLPPSERQVRILGAVVAPASHLTVIAAAEVLQCRAIGPEAIGDDDLGTAMSFHRFLQELQGCRPVPLPGDIALEHFPFVIDGAPEIMRLAVDLHEDLVEMPAVLHSGAQALDPFASDLGGEHRPEAVPPVAHRFVADLDAAFVEEILHIPERQRVADVEHHRQADDLGARFEVAKGGALGHGDEGSETSCPGRAI